MNHAEKEIEHYSNIISDVIRKHNNRKIYDVIITTISNELSIPVSSILEKTRKREIVEARQLCQYFIFKKTEKERKIYTYRYIAELTGVTHHTTVMHGIKCVNNQISVDRKFSEKVNYLERMLNLDLSQNYES